MRFDVKSDRLSLDRMRERLFGLAYSLLATTALAAAPSLVPLPQQMQTLPGVFTLCGSQPVPGAPAYALTKILADPAGQQTAEYLAGLLIRSTGYKFQIITNSATKDATQNIAPAFVRGKDSIGDRERKRADVVGNYPKRHVDFFLLWIDCSATAPVAPGSEIGFSSYFVSPAQVPETQTIWTTAIAASFANFNARFVGQIPKLFDTIITDLGLL